MTTEDCRDVKTDQCISTVAKALDDYIALAGEHLQHETLGKARDYANDFIHGYDVDHDETALKLELRKLEKERGELPLELVLSAQALVRRVNFAKEGMILKQRR